MRTRGARADLPRGPDDGWPDQPALSAGTIFNIERARDWRPETLWAIRRALAREGVLVAFSRNNGLAMADTGVTV
jgi:hypothetical protein